ncbi:MAG: hypothetical protein JSW59_18155 [Phycisphaerales bacterium]|nr:MAG: hypothetical protein JSW59_18155 [Phycisphaerales bacterium]
MNRKRTAILGIVALICGAISFFNARSTALSGREPEQWLDKASDSVLAIEEKFQKEMAALIATLMDEQNSLGSALEDPCTPDEVVLERAESVIGAHERLIRRAGEHVVELRGKLSADDREHLMSLCAETVRGPIRRLEGRGGGRGRHNGAGRGYGYGRQGRGGRGGGYGMRRAVRNRLANCLELDERQVSLLNQEDAEFETETADLRDHLLAERARLLSMFEDSRSEDNPLLRQIEKLITAHSAIERRIVRHVLVMRPYLTGEQQKWLIGLCRRNQEKSPPAGDPK